MTTVRRSAAVLAASAVLCVTLAQTAVAGGDVRAPSPDAPSATPAPSAPPANGAPTTSSTSTPAAPAAHAGLSAPRPSSLPPGLYGTEDPAEDGVWRQSLAMLGQYAAGQRPARSAILWLKGQQCASGAFPTYRADPGAPCDADTATDPNATAAAVQALSTLGGQRPVMLSALNWLRGVQNADGGWGHTPGGPSDANSTSLVIGALSATGIRPSSFRSPEGHHAYDALLGLAVPCGKDGKSGKGGAGTGATGGFAYQRAPEGQGSGTARPVADNDATAAAVLAGVGKRMVVAPVKAGPAPVCRRTARLTPERAARNGAAYLASALAATGHLDRPPVPGTSDSTPLADPGSTADAVAALASSGYANQAAGALEWLKKNAGPWAAENGPAAYAQLIFAAHTTGTDPRDFGGLDLVRLLNATGPAPTPVPSITAQPVAEIRNGGLGGTGFGIVWVIGIGLAAGIAIGYLLSSRGRTGQHQEL
ncbi:prenyltransferase/squalene oxidase repeat-containing protein [Streptomyces liangshanensis]|uniref:prenyltransferase/squalene oxidase repeat-containing protein n=1 Tax=Streptomyces liangshanensis TaxID=2717324 RepID=UPI0036DBB40E